jgi:hypothetical protein
MGMVLSSTPKSKVGKIRGSRAIVALDCIGEADFVPSKFTILS